MSEIQRIALRLLPPRVVAGLARAHRPFARWLAVRHSRGVAPHDWDPTVHPSDELVTFGIAQLAEDGVPFRYYRSLRRYYEGGGRNTSEIAELLATLGVPLVSARSILEFACGYGRVTRHLVTRVSPTKITVSEIDRDAVDFVTRTFGVRGFYSTSEPEDLVHGDRYDLVLVVSLFSHLPIQSWARWLRRLEQLVQPGGLLVFSTIPWQTGGRPPIEEQREAFELGMLYSEVNETGGRLSGTEYGTAFTRTEFVEGVVAEHFDGTLVKHLPGALNGVQDVYVLRRTA
jgi:2-polyprenyl-3-methyl-5-hydroxy-6-metoxy-1,4-benzoquinol methylase